MKRRAFLSVVLAAAVVPAFAQTKQPMKIGVIGSGRIGSTIGGLWVKAGHEVMFSDRDPEAVKRAIADLGPRARAGSTHEAASFGDAARNRPLPVI
jgi:3-hydroxyacyl-CoA dehydrogenase